MGRLGISMLGRSLPGRTLLLTRYRGGRAEVIILLADRWLQSLHH